MKKLMIVLILFGVIFIETSTEKILEYNSMNTMESIFVEDMSSYNINVSNVENYDKLVMDVSDFVEDNKNVIYTFNFNETIPVQIYSMPTNLKYPMIDGERFTDNEIPESLIGLNFETLNGINEKKLGEEITYDDISTIVTGRIGTPTFLSDFNSVIVSDMDTLQAYPNIFSNIVSINIANPNKLDNFEKIKDDFQDVLTQNNVLVSPGNSKYSGVQTSIKQFSKQILIQISGIAILLIIVLLIAINTMIVSERKKYAVYKLLGHSKKSIFIINLKEKSKILIKTVVIAIVVQYIMSIVLSDIFFTPNSYAISCYILSNIIIILMFLILLYKNIYYRTIREDL